MHILHLNQRNQILFQYLRDKKKKERRGLRKRGEGGGGENSPISPPLDPRLNACQWTKLALLAFLSKLANFYKTLQVYHIQYDELICENKCFYYYYHHHHHFTALFKNTR